MPGRGAFPGNVENKSSHPQVTGVFLPLSCIYDCLPCITVICTNPLMLSSQHLVEGLWSFWWNVMDVGTPVKFLFQASSVMLNFIELTCESEIDSYS